MHTINNISHVQYNYETRQLQAAFLTGAYLYAK